MTDEVVLQRSFRLLQISDCHLAADRARLYRGCNADAGLEALLGAVAEFDPQQIMLTGDLSEDASESSYRRLQSALDSVEVPVCALPGNHDDDVVMQRFFPHGPWDGPLTVLTENWNLVLLRSSRPARIDGELSDSDLTFLQESCSVSSDDRPVMLALHHQPIPVGSPWIDRYMLTGAADFMELIESEERIRAVVWGHVHQAFRSRLGKAQLLACPSSAVNSLPMKQKFQQDPAGPACRWFELKADGTFETGILQA